MESVSVRELRNNVSQVLRRVESGEHLQVTVHGRPVAELTPLQRPRFVPAAGFLATLPHADTGLSTLLLELAPDTTEDIPLH
ncbi:MAG: type II toxin-antitoxin system Phd/YefM family antitoxin [Candidatus Dormibacteria bacterium]